MTTRIIRSLALALCAAGVCTLASAKLPAPSCWYRPMAMSATAATTSISTRSGRQNQPSQMVHGMAPSKMPFS